MYYEKYIKYKSKYLKLRNAIGGNQDTDVRIYKNNGESIYISEKDIKLLVENIIKQIPSSYYKTEDFQDSLEKFINNSKESDSYHIDITVDKEIWDLIKKVYESIYTDEPIDTSKYIAIANNTNGDIIKLYRDMAIAISRELLDKYIEPARRLEFFSGRFDNYKSLVIFLDDRESQLFSKFYKDPPKKDISKKDVPCVENNDLQKCVYDDSYDCKYHTNDASCVMNMRPIRIPKYTYPIDQTVLADFKKHINDNCGDKTTQILEQVDILLKRGRHVSFKEFMNHLIKTVDKFLERIKKEKFILYIPNPTAHADKCVEYKSNFWVSQLVYCILKSKNVIPCSVLYILPTYDTGGMNILLCDDGIYSGQQMGDIVYYLLSGRSLYTENDIFPVIEKIDKKNVFIISPLITEIALDKLKHVNIFYDYIMETLSGRTNTGIYLDTRYPDAMSSTGFYRDPTYVSGAMKDPTDARCLGGFDKNMIKGCVGNDELCPYPPYKKGVPKDDILLVAVDDFIKNYIQSNVGYDNIKTKP